MLAYSDLQPINLKNLEPFHFRTPLKLIRRHKNIYMVYLDTDREIRVFQTASLQTINKVNCLKDMFQVPLFGFLMTKAKPYTYLAFAPEPQVEATLQYFVSRRKQKGRIPCLTLPQTQKLLNFLLESCEKLTKNHPTGLALLTPRDIMVVETESDIHFKFSFPLAELLLESVSQRLEFYKQDLQFCAPEIIKQTKMTQGSAEVTGTEIVYSIGLIILYAVLGESFSKEQRLKGLEDKKDFEAAVKFQRRQIKTYFNQKIISKTVSILLETDGKVRDDFKTLSIKLESAQFQHLRAKYPPPPPVNETPSQLVEDSVIQNQDELNIPRIQTMEDADQWQNSSKISGGNRTIMLHLSKNTEHSLKISKNCDNDHLPSINGTASIKETSKGGMTPGLNARNAVSQQDIDEVFQQAGSPHQQSSHMLPLINPRKQQLAEEDIEKPRLIVIKPQKITITNHSLLAISDANQKSTDLEAPKHNSGLVGQSILSIIPPPVNLLEEEASSPVHRYYTRMERELSRFNCMSLVTLVLIVVTAGVLGLYEYFVLGKPLF